MPRLISAAVMFHLEDSGTWLLVSYLKIKPQMAEEAETRLLFPRRDSCKWKGSQGCWRRSARSSCDLTIPCGLHGWARVVIPWTVNPTESRSEPDA